MERKSLQWFGVKTAYRISAKGHPRNKAKGYHPGSCLMEERVVLIQAKDAAAALEKAEIEAREYSKLIYKNMFEQQVKIAYLGVADCFSIDESPGDCVEVYSRNEVLIGNHSDKQIRRCLLGSCTREDPWIRQKFIADGIMKELIGRMKATSGTSGS